MGGCTAFVPAGLAAAGLLSVLGGATAGREGPAAPLFAVAAP